MKKNIRRFFASRPQSPSKEEIPISQMLKGIITLVIVSGVPCFAQCGVGGGKQVIWPDETT